MAGRLFRKLRLSKSVAATFSLILSMVSATGLAADEDDSPRNHSKTSRTRSGKKVVDPEEAVVKGSSEYNREGKTAYIALELFGLNPLSSSGLMAGKYFGPDQIIDGSWTTGKFELFGFTMKSSSYAVRYKKFNGNSFYWRVGGMVRTFDYNTNFSLFSDDQSKNGKVSVTSIGFDGAIGNQWQWDNFTIGCDWIGLFVPLVGSYTVSRPEGSTDAWYNNEKNDAEKLSKRGSMEALRFYLGASF